jgi:hypothetical protein
MILALVLGACEGLGGGDDDGNNDKGTEVTVSFNSFSPPSIYVDNNTSERLFAFKGDTNPNSLIGGIPA